MIKINLYGVHNFKKRYDFTQEDRKECYDAMICAHCKLIGRKIDRNDYVYVSDTFSKERIEKCKRDEFIDQYVDKQIQVSCRIKRHENIPTYSIHTIVKPPKRKYINGEAGVWILVDEKPWKILLEEFIYYPLKRRKKPIEKDHVKRSKINFKKEKRIRIRKIKRIRIKKVKRIRK